MIIKLLCVLRSSFRTGLRINSLDIGTTPISVLLFQPLRTCIPAYASCLHLRTSPSAFETTSALCDFSASSEETVQRTTVHAQAMVVGLSLCSLRLRSMLAASINVAWLGFASLFGPRHGAYHCNVFLHLILALHTPLF